MSDIDGKGGATNDHAIRDQELILTWLGVYETGNSGFRFVRIDLLDTDAILELKEVRAISIMRDIPYRFPQNVPTNNGVWDQEENQFKNSIHRGQCRDHQKNRANQNTN